MDVTDFFQAFTAAVGNTTYTLAQLKTLFASFFFTSSPTISAAVSRSLVAALNATGFQPNATGMCFVSYTVSVSTTATIGGASIGGVYLEYAATNSTTPSDWKQVSGNSSGQTITLAIVLQSIQPITSVVSGWIPAGSFVRIRTQNLSGSPTFSYIMGQEILF